MQPIARTFEQYFAGLENNERVFFVSLQYINKNDNYDNYRIALHYKKSLDHAPAGSTFHFSLFTFHFYGTGLALAV